MWRVRRSIANNPTRNSLGDVSVLGQDLKIHKEQYLYNPTAEVFTQDEANKLFEPVQPEFAEWTADANSSIHNTMMFAPVFPLGLLILLLKNPRKSTKCMESMKIREIRETRKQQKINRRMK